MLDRLTKGGAERRTATESLGEASIHIRYAAHAFKMELEHATTQETVRRERLAIEVPRLSPEASAQLTQLEALRSNDRNAYERGVATLAASREVAEEIRLVNTALRKRFGEMTKFDTEDDRGKIDQLVPPAERAPLEQTRATLAAVQRFEGERATLKILNERLEQRRERGRSLES
jgi:hypothetical protein